MSRKSWHLAQSFRNENQKQLLVEKKSRLKKPEPCSDDAPEFEVAKSHWANSELLVSDPPIIKLTRDDVADEILGCLEGSNKATMTEKDGILSYAGDDFSGVAEFGSLEEFLSIADEEAGWFDHGLPLAEIFPPPLAGMSKSSSLEGKLIE
ncbi:hypothetical protein Peur_015056 [Populus x canadensis]